MKITVTFDIESEMDRPKLTNWFMRTMDLFCETMPTNLKENVLQIRQIQVSSFRIIDNSR